MQPVCCGFCFPDSTQITCTFPHFLKKRKSSLLARNCLALGLQSSSLNVDYLSKGVGRNRSCVVRVLPAGSSGSGHVAGVRAAASLSSLCRHGVDRSGAGERDARPSAPEPRPAAF